ncbi:aldehyde dehydrogenase family protein [Acholeplasma equirhinis]|uniref:aldehyde dehydrogenase family protein n=1 Tax=Acholeplasma equirhinis TaxID=555393 RepID=UPI00197AD45E|nr:aldehyde dehydrogenase family protein [Acholeplasma equirhinis]MBN3489898.1 aldehyde dehydrogenase family protein [Acholeplasma equirhinis]
MTYQERISYLKRLKEVILKYELDIKEALYLDLGKSSQESYITEIGLVLSEITYHMKHLKKWMKPKRVKNTLAVFPAKSFLVPEPFGKVLIIGPWNYPFQLIFNPLVGAISAGNKAVLKPSELAVNTEKLIVKLIKEVFSEDLVEVVTGGVEVTQELLNQRFDYIFFTGSTNVGKIIMRAASNNLTPVTLELGGKSPAIVMDTKDIKHAAYKIAFGKLINAGQTCIAPDYVLIREKDKPSFIEYYKEAVTKYYGSNPLESNDYPKIINNRHHQRLLSLVKETTILYGGTSNEFKIAPTIVEPKINSKIMVEEIFGPILPIITINQIEEIKDYIQEKPLATYLFTESKKIEDYVINNISTGGMTINDTLMHFSNHHLGFGGVGHSGMGKYHGKHSFDTFTHFKPVLKKSKHFDVPAKYLPSSDKKERFIKHILK